MSIAPASFAEKPIELVLHLYQKAAGHICVGLLLPGSLFYSTDLCVYPSTNNTVLIFVAILKLDRLITPTIFIFFKITSQFCLSFHINFRINMSVSAKKS